MMLWLALVGWAVWVGRTEGEGAFPSPQATAIITNGSLVGFNTGNIAYFLGIPYASPPIGPLRFKTTVGANLPVMVFLHGGDYTTGLSSDYKPDAILNLAGRGVVVVTFDYRLNLFGFLSSENGESSNAGMLDQVQALRWVEGEIRNFGGDPNRVTLVGHGAGASAASLHTFSPLSKDLFDGVVQMSGSGFLSQALFGGHNRLPSPSFQLASALGCADPVHSNSLSASALSCLRNASVDTLLHVANKTMEMSSVNWSPHVGSADGFLPNWPRLIPRQSKIPIMMGTTANEQYVFQMQQLLNDEATAQSLYNSKQFHNAIQQIAASWGNYSTDVEKILFQAYSPKALSIANWFSAISDVTRAYLMMLINYTTENGAKYLGRMLSDARDGMEKGLPIYLYSFDYISDIFPWPKYQGIPLQGPYHGMDLHFLFNRSSLPTSAPAWNFSSNDFKMSQHFSQIIINFISSGDPNTISTTQPLWLPFTQHSAAYYSLAYPNSGTKLGLAPRADSVWNKEVPALTGNFGPTFPSFTGTGPTPYPPMPCEKEPCENGGKCRNGGVEGYSCECVEGWLGPRCSMAPCSVKVENRGAFVLVASYEDGGIVRKEARMAVGQKASFTAVRGEVLFLQAVWGKKTSCLLTASMCQNTVQVSCKGTTFVGFQCSCN